MTASTVDVSVILPVYNAEAYLAECLDSVMDQKLGQFSMEVIAIDDGSTDGSGDMLDAYANRFPQLTVVHQENSGWPGMPRNVGIGMAAGRYIFFCDSDDYLGEESLQRLVSFADRYGSDLVIPKLVGFNGRWIRRSIYRETQVDADLVRASQSSGPTKLFRRSVIEQNRMLFPVKKTPAEDTIFLFQMFAASKRVSILADYDYYFVRLRDDGGNISMQPTDPAVYAQALIEASSHLENNLSDRATERAVILELFRRIGLNKYEAGYATASPQRRQAWVQAHQQVLDRFLPAGAEMALKSPQRERMALIREGRISDLVRMALLPDYVLKAHIERVTRTRTGMVFRGAVKLEERFNRFSSVRLQLRSRAYKGLVYQTPSGHLSIDKDQSEVAPTFESYVVHVGAEMLAAMPTGVWDISAVITVDGKEITGRLAVAPESRLAPVLHRTVLTEPYATIHNNLSLRITESRGGRRLRQRVSFIGSRVGKPDSG